MLNGDGHHYRVTDRFHHERGRYFIARGDSQMLKTFKSLVKNATNYVVVDTEVRGDTFRAEIGRGE